MSVDMSRKCRSCGWVLTPDKAGLRLSCPLCGSVYAAADYERNTPPEEEKHRSGHAHVEEEARIALNAALRVAQDSLQHGIKRKK